MTALALGKDSSGGNGFRAGLVSFAAVAIGVAAFAGALYELTLRWQRQEEYSHGFLIPVVALWLLWSRRDALRANLGAPSWTGPAVILAALAVHFVGEISAIFAFSQLSFILVLVGIALSVGGLGLLRVVLIPIVFLLFAIPLPYFIESQLTLQLQMISSQLGVWFISLFGIPVYLEGNIIDLGYYKLAVVEACSGLRYLYPLFSLGFLAAYLFQAPLWQRAIVLLSTIPITITMNGFRIGMVGVLVDRWGSRMAEGALHFFEGWIIFIACAGFLAIEILVLARLSGRTFADAFHVPKIPTRSPSSGSNDGRPAWTTLALLCFAGVSLLFISSRSEAVPERTRFAEFPTRIGQWQGRATLLDPEVERGLQLDDYVMTDFAKGDGRRVNLYVAYYGSQRKGVSPHSPIVCIPGGGWLITNLQRTTYDDAALAFPINRAIIERDATRELMYYWYDERGRKIASEWWAKWYLFADAVTKNRTDGALVRLTTRILPGETERDADRRLRAFVQDVVPSLARYLPSDTTVTSNSTLVSPRKG